MTVYIVVFWGYMEDYTIEKLFYSITGANNYLAKLQRENARNADNYSILTFDVE